MRKIPYRVSLPVVFGTIAIALMVWDHHVMRRCVYFDDGLPFWSCQIPRFLLTAFNLPAMALSRPVVSIIAAFSGGYGYKFEYLVQFPIILLWWWLVGTRADFGLLAADHSKRRKTWVSGLTVLASVLFCLFGWAVWEAWTEIRLDLHHYGFDRVTLIPFVKAFALLPWFAGLSYAAAVAAFRIARGTTCGVTVPLVTLRQTRIVIFSFAAYIAICVGLILHTRATERQLQAQEDAASMIITGKVVDDYDRPIKGIEVNLVPRKKREDGTHFPGPYAWTDEHGVYSLRPDMPRDYFIAVMWEQAPYPSEPFLTRFYPDSSDERHAETLSMTPALHLTVSTIKLHRIDLVRIPIGVFWSNGQPEPSASILIQNLLFSHEAGIGSASMFPERDGTLAVPAGFDYRAIASVTCNGEKVLTSPYTPPVEFNTKSGAVPTALLRLVLPGAPCILWHPK